MDTVQSKFVDVGGLKIHYTTVGNNTDLPPLLFLHGWPTNAALYRNIMPGLAKQRRVIAFDFPGFGKSDKPKEIRYSFGFFDKFMGDLCAALGIDDVGLVVHDLGGPIGLHWAIKNPDRIRELVVLNTLAYPQFHPAVVLFIAGLKIPFVAKKITTPAAVKWTMRFGVRQKDRMTRDVAKLYSAPYEDPHARRLLQKSGSELSVRGFARIAKGLDKIAHVPTALIYGKGDRVLPDVAKTMARLHTVWPDAKLAALPEAGHFLQEDVPEELVRQLGEFLAQRPH